MTYFVHPNGYIFVAQHGTDITQAARLLREGQLVAIPTETVYGLAGNAMDEQAVGRIFSVKNRPSFDPLIVHVASVERILPLVSDFPDTGRELASLYMPGPLTLLLPKSREVSDFVTAGSQRVAVRIPRHPLTLELLEKLDFPLAAPSANPFGYISPTTAAHVERQLGHALPYILDGGSCEVGIESTIIGWGDSGQVVVYRKGGMSIEEIENVSGLVKVMPHSSSRPDAPGMLASHYAPSAPVLLGDLKELAKEYAGQRIGVISFREGVDGIPEERQVILSKVGDYAEAARRLFAGMRELDALGLEGILAELLPEEGLGRAINDRLRRAAATGETTEF
jgi:L-threonylcarbamoyladenylate synthase